MRNPSRTTAWSSTIRTRGSCSAGHLEPDRRPRARRASGSADAPPSSRARSSIEVSPRWRGAQLRRWGLEADPVVGDRDRQRAVVVPRATTRDVRRARVAQRVVDRLVGDPQHAPGSAPRAPSTSTVDRRARSATPWTRSSIAISLRSAPASPSRSSSGGRRPRISERSSSSASRASAWSRWTCDAPRPPRRVAVEQRRRRLGR